MNDKDVDSSQLLSIVKGHFYQSMTTDAVVVVVVVLYVIVRRYRPSESDE